MKKMIWFALVVLATIVSFATEAQAQWRPNNNCYRPAYRPMRCVQTRRVVVRRSWSSWGNGYVSPNYNYYGGGYGWGGGQLGGVIVVQPQPPIVVAAPPQQVVVVPTQPLRVLKYTNGQTIQAPPDGFVETGHRLHGHGSNKGLVDWIKGTINGKEVEIEYNDNGLIEEIDD